MRSTGTLDSLPSASIKVADFGAAWNNALISRRVYKPPMPFDKARDVIAGDRGTHFDPDVVDAFGAGFVTFQAIAERYADTEASVTAKLAAVRGEA